MHATHLIREHQLIVFICRVLWTQDQNTAGPLLLFLSAAAVSSGTLDPSLNLNAAPAVFSRLVSMLIPLLLPVTGVKLSNNQEI